MNRYIIRGPGRLNFLKRIYLAIFFLIGLFPCSPLTAQASQTGEEASSVQESDSTSPNAGQRKTDSQEVVYNLSHLQWTYSLRAARHLFYDAPIHKFTGSNLSIDLGLGWIRDEWIAYSGLSVYMGPFAPAKPDYDIGLDFQGTGFYAKGHYPLFEGGVRRPGGQIGLTLGIDYSELSGRSYKAVSVREQPSLSSGLEGTVEVRYESYTSLIRAAHATLGFCMMVMQPARPLGSQPDLITTRLEGALLSLNMRVPVWGTYQSEFLRAVAGESFNQARANGSLRGLIFELQLALILGV